jgi:N-formylglutamate amidohydrolase
MNTFKIAALAALTLAAASPALAQTATGGPLANDGPYAGASPKDFYRPSDRIAQIQAEIQQGALAGTSAHRAMAELTAIREDLKYRIARHNGELLDWDRELINQKLDALVKQYPALRT